MRASRAGGAGADSSGLGRRAALADADDPRPLDDDRRGAALDGDAVVLDVLHLPDQAAAGGDLVALLERREQLLVLLPGLALRADDQEIEDGADGRDLQDQDREAAATARAGGRGHREQQCWGHVSPRW